MTSRLRRCLSGSLLFLIVPALLQAQRVTTWRPPEGEASDRYYRVTVDGVEVPVYDTAIASWAMFDFEGVVTVRVETMFDVRWVDVRPLAAGIKPTYVSDHVFTLTLDRPQNLSIELNGRIRQQPLFLFSNAPETERPDRGDPNIIWFEGGRLYDNVQQEIKSGQTVYLEGGAVVRGLLFGEQVQNVKVMGRGILDGAKNREMAQYRRQFIDFRDSRKIQVQDVVLQNATTWQIALFNCDDATIRNVRIVSEAASDDGIDIFRCRNVLVEGVFAHTKDDCIAIKSGGEYPADLPTDNILVRDCVFWNSIWGNAIEVGFELYSDEVKNIRFENIDIIHVEDGAAISIHNAGPAHVHHVVFENIRLEDVRQKLFDVAIFFSQWGPDGIRDPEFIRQNYLHGAWDGVQKVPAGREAHHRQFRGRVSDVIFRNIHIVDGQLPFSVFHGYDDERNVERVLVENLTFYGRRLTDQESAKIRLQNVKDFEIR
jgi:hypothetical protein